MIGLISRLLGRATPALSEARPSDAATIAELHKDFVSARLGRG